MISAPCAAIGEHLGELFDCTPKGSHIRIRTPYLYPDGDVLDLFLTTNEHPQRLTDLGETLRWLSLQASSQKRTKKQLGLIQDTCVTLGVELYKGMLQKRIHADNDLAASVTLLAQAAVRVSDLWFTFRSRSYETLNDEVAEFLQDRKISFDRQIPLVGRSGTVWKVDFQTRTPQRTSLVNVLSTGSRATARKLAEHTLATWYDLSNLRAGAEAFKFVSLFDDAFDVWTDEDVRLLEDLSEVVYWSHPENFADRLAA